MISAVKTHFSNDLMFQVAAPADPVLFVLASHNRSKVVNLAIVFNPCKLLTWRDVYYSRFRNVVTTQHSTKQGRSSALSCSQRATLDVGTLRKHLIRACKHVLPDQIETVVKNRTGSRTAFYVNLNRVIFIGWLLPRFDALMAHEMLDTVQIDILGG